MDGTQSVEQSFNLMYGQYQQLKYQQNSQQIQNQVLIDIIQVTAQLRQKADYFDILGNVDNFEISEISTNELKYLLVDFIHGQCLIKLKESDLSKRIKILENSQNCYKACIKRCLQLHLTYDVNETLIHLVLGNKTDIDVKSLAYVERNFKVYSYKQQKYLQQQLEQLAELKKDQMTQNLIEQDGEEQDVFDQNNQNNQNNSIFSDENERNFWLLSIHQSLIEAINQVQYINKESQMIQFNQEQLKIREGSGQTVYQQPKEDIQKQQQVRQSLQIISKALEMQNKDKIKEQVFQNRYNNPKYSVEQQGEWEVKEMQERQRAQEQYLKQQDLLKGDEDNYRYYDNHVVKELRSKDEFKDDHPIGSGNSKLRPTA